MIRIIRILLVGAFAATATLVPIAAVRAHSSVDIVASNWKFTPSTVELHVGETTTLRLTSSEGVHGLKSDELGIPQTLIPPGKAVTVDVTPKTAGTYKVHCSLVCGAGHPDMALTVNVIK